LLLIIPYLIRGDYDTVMDALPGGGAAAGRGLVVGVLGPVEVVSPTGGLAGVAQPMLRILVAMLGVMAGRVVPDEALVDGLWGVGGAVNGSPAGHNCPHVQREA
jgi:hypothetical protein